MEYDHDRGVPGMSQGIGKGKRHIVIVAVVSLIIALVLLHIVAANSIYKAGGFSLKNPLSYLMMGGFLLVGAVKLTYLWRVKHGKRNHFKK
jgi:hypothetical protein